MPQSSFINKEKIMFIRNNKLLFVIYLMFSVCCRSSFASTEELVTYSDVGDILNIQRMIKAGAKVNIVDNEGATPLYMASQNGHYKVVELLLAAKANVNVVRTDVLKLVRNITPLSMASLNGHYEVVKLLLTYHPDDFNLFMASSTALQNGHNRIYKLLKDYEKFK